MRIGFGLGVSADPARAAADAARQAAAGVPRPDLTLAFGGVRLDQRGVWKGLCSRLDPARTLGGSSYLEISPAGVTRDSVVVMNLELPGARVSLSSAALGAEPALAARRLAAGLPPPSGALSLGLVFGAMGGPFGEALGPVSRSLGGAGLFGGMACGDYDLGMAHPDFWKSWQYSGGRLRQNVLGAALIDLPDGWTAAFGCEHGWDPVAPAARLTRCEGGRVYEIDGMPIFDYYRQFLGGDASKGFFELMIQRFAFAVRPRGSERTLLKLPVICDFKRGCIEYFPAEDLQGREVQLIQASRKGLLEGAARAARRCREALGRRPPRLALMVSCCTRGWILHSGLERELDAVRAALGREVPVFGYYSGGEVAPLHNRFADALAGPDPLSGSFYHTTTVCLLVLSGPSKPVVRLPRAAARRQDAAALSRQLARAEQVLDQTESFLANLSRKSYRDGERLRRQNEVIHRYTPHQVWNEVGEQVARGVFELDDREFEGAFLFMDVKGFTGFSESRPAPEVVRTLNELFDPATRLIYEHGGDVDKFIGDCIFAAFREPRRAVECARRVLGLFRDAAARGNPFSVRIGINAGRAVRANVGSSERREYTFIGDAVNLAQRLESNATPGAMLVSERVYESARDLLADANRRELTVKGRRGAVVAYEAGS